MKIRTNEKVNKTPKPKSGIGKTIAGGTGIVLAFLISLGIVNDVSTPNKFTDSDSISQTYSIVESEGGTYFGNLEGIAYQGVGEFQYLTGEIYEGDFLNSTRSGEGTLLLKNGDSISGAWSDDQVISGTYLYADGRSFNGTFTEDGRFDAGTFTGEIVYIDGSKYTGEIVKSKRGGQGTYSWPNGDSFSGNWENDSMGEGTYSFADGRSYSGTFKNNKFYSGTFSLGELAEANGYSSFKAVFSNGKITGYDLVSASGVSYKGDVTGKADITYSTGNTYSGDVVDGVRNGTGTFKWIKNATTTAYYEGSWKDGIMNGKGNYYYSSASYPYITGNFVDGKPDGTATYYKEAGNTFTTTWANGYCSKVTES